MKNNQRIKIWVSFLSGGVLQILYGDFGLVHNDVGLLASFTAAPRFLLHNLAVIPASSTATEASRASTTDKAGGERKPIDREASRDETGESK